MTLFRSLASCRNVKDDCIHPVVSEKQKLDCVVLHKELSTGEKSNLTVSALNNKTTMIEQDPIKVNVVKESEGNPAISEDGTVQASQDHGSEGSPHSQNRSRIAGVWMMPNISVRSTVRKTLKIRNFFSSSYLRG